MEKLFTEKSPTLSPKPTSISIPSFKGNRTNAEGPLAVENDAEFLILLHKLSSS